MPPLKVAFIPAIIATNQRQLDIRLKKILPSSQVHLDIMDDSFVPNSSLEFSFNLPKGPKYEVHLMVVNPKPWITHLHKQIAHFIIHYESKAHLHELITLARILKKKITLAINPDTPTEAIRQYLSLIDRVLIMTVYPGKYGSKFLPQTVHKINFLRTLAPKLDIMVDGGITPKTIAACKEAGANQFSIGSYLQKSAHPKKALTLLKKSI